MHHAYSRRVLLNARSIKTLSRAFLRQGSTRARISWAEFATVLETAEIFALSRSIFFDGTVPSRDAEEVRSLADRLQESARRETDLRLAEISAVRPGGAGSLADQCAAAGELAAPLWRQLTSRQPALEGVDRPLAEREAKKVTQEFERWILEQRSAAPSQANQRILRLAQEIEEGRDTFRGSKCAVAIAKTEDDEGPLIEHVADLFAKVASSEKSLLVPALINRFRINFLAQYSAGHHAPFVADPSIRQLRLTQQELLWKWLAKRSAQMAGLGIGSKSPSLEQGLLVFPIGLFALMRSRTDSPWSLLRSAAEIGIELVKILRARGYSMGTLVSEVVSEDESAISSEEAQDLAAELNLGIQQDSPMWYRSTRLAIPLITGAVGAVIGTILGPLGLAATAALSAGSAALGMGGERFAELLDPNRDYEVAVDSYRRFTQYLSGTVINASTVTALASKAEAVLGVEVGPPPRLHH